MIGHVFVHVLSKLETQPTEQYKRPAGPSQMLKSLNIRWPFSFFLTLFSFQTNNMMKKGCSSSAVLLLISSVAAVFLLAMPVSSLAFQSTIENNNNNNNNNNKPNNNAARLVTGQQQQQQQNQGPMLVSNDAPVLLKLNSNQEIQQLFRKCGFFHLIWNFWILKINRKSTRTNAHSAWSSKSGNLSFTLYKMYQNFVSSNLLSNQWGLLSLGPSNGRKIDEHWQHRLLQLILLMLQNGSFFQHQQ